MSVGLPNLSINLDEFNLNCREAGLTEVSAGTLMSNARVGQALRELGAIKIGRTKLLVSDERLGKVFQLAESMVTRKLDLDLPPEAQPPLPSVDDKVRLLTLMMMTAKAQSSNAAKLIESSDLDGTDGAKRSSAPSFLPGKAVVMDIDAEMSLRK